MRSSYFQVSDIFERVDCRVKMGILLRRYCSFGLFLTSILIGHTESFSQKAILVQDTQELLLIGKQLQFLEDPSGKLQLEDILNHDYQQQFVDHDKEVFNRPGTSSAFWFKIVVKNYCEEDSWLEVGSTYAWYIDFYAPDSSGSYAIPIKTGTMRPDQNKLYDVNFFWLPLNSAHDTMSKTYYFRVASGLTFEMPLHVATLRSLNKNKVTNDFLTAGFIGMFLIIFFYNLFIYVSTKDHIYLPYLGYLLFMAVSMPYANGYPFIQKIDFLFFDKEWWNEYFIIWHNPVYAFIGLFCIQYLEMKKNSPILRKLILFEISIISIAFPLLNVVGFQFVELVNVLQSFILLLYLTCLFSGYYFIGKKVKQAYFYTIGWTFMVLGAFTFFAVINGLLPFNTFTRNTLYFGVAIEASLFSLALANRLNVLRKEKEKTEAEKTEIIKCQNEKLESMVKERTEELQAINEELLQSNEEQKLISEKLHDQGNKLKESNNSKDMIFAIIAHDLRSPMQSLKGLINLMRGFNLSPEEFFEHSENLKKGVEHAHFLLNNLLQWANSQMHGLTIKPVILNLRKIFQDNILLIQELIGGKNISIKIDIDQNTFVKADQDHVDIIIRNLLSNAMKFTDTGGKISINANVKGEVCEVSITDTGIGMSENKVNSLWQNDSAIATQRGTEGEKGTGIGLVLCKVFSEENGGKIWVESKKGSGSTFYFTLPIN